MFVTVTRTDGVMALVNLDQVQAILPGTWFDEDRSYDGSALWLSTPEDTLMVREPITYFLDIIHAKERRK